MSVAMSATKSIILEIERFSAKLVYREERSKSSPYNIPNFTNPMVSIIEELNDTFDFNETTSQTGRLKLLEEMSN